jgi:CheY-like chemotaxis protein
MHGDDVMARLKADPAFNGTPVVILSADATTGRIERLLQSGADAYLSKPIDVQQFLGVINEHAPAPAHA